jgi:hypothetical protein
MAVVANQAVAFDKSMLMACPHLGDVLRPGLILENQKLSTLTRKVQIRGKGRSSWLLGRQTPNPQPNPQSMMSCTTYAVFGSPLQRPSFSWGS